MVAVEAVCATLGTAPACRVVGVPRATVYRHRRPRPAAPVTRPRPGRALSDPEKQVVVSALHSGHFADKTPAQVYATLLDEGIYHCSIRTMYRILAERCEVRERRSQLRHPAYEKPELLATGPNQVWSWVITKLRGPEKWTLYYLYVILDIFSRYVVGWLLAHGESAALAKRLIADTCIKENIEPGQLTIHADRGSSMRSKPVAHLLAELDITKTHSRPHVSDDNPFSEAQFKTLKYRPDFPKRFGGYDDALGFCHGFFPYYNFEHRHSGIGLMTPASVHHGRAPVILAARQQTLLAAYKKNPERFVRKPPSPPRLPSSVWINPPREETTLYVPPQATIVTLSEPRDPRISDLAGSTSTALLAAETIPPQQEAH